MQGSAYYNAGTSIQQYDEEGTWLGGYSSRKTSFSSSSHLLYFFLLIIHVACLYIMLDTRQVCYFTILKMVLANDVAEEVLLSTATLQGRPRGDVQTHMSYIYPHSRRRLQLFWEVFVSLRGHTVEIFFTSITECLQRFYVNLKRDGGIFGWMATFSIGSIQDGSEHSTALLIQVVHATYWYCFDHHCIFITIFCWILP